MNEYKGNSLFQNVTLQVDGYIGLQAFKSAVFLSFIYDNAPCFPILPFALHI
jgi:hypothetical protein